MNKELFENLARIEHERWSDWQKYMHSKGKKVVSSLPSFSISTGDLIIPSVLVEQWERQIATPYSELSEKEKDSDREQVNRYWPLLEKILYPSDEKKDE